MKRSELIQTIREGKEKVSYILLNTFGGNWLGRIRSWIQWNAYNGDDVNWGSDSYLRLKSLTVKDMETIASQIAADALVEYSDNLVTDEEKRELAVYKNPLNWTVEDGKMVFKPEHGLAFYMINIKEGHNLNRFLKEKDLQNS
jgi:hypothetical protein